MPWLFTWRLGIKLRPSHFCKHFAHWAITPDTMLLLNPILQISSLLLEIFSQSYQRELKVSLKQSVCMERSALGPAKREDALDFSESTGWDRSTGWADGETGPTRQHCSYSPDVLLRALAAQLLLLFCILPALRHRKVPFFFFLENTMLGSIGSPLAGV